MAKTNEQTFGELPDDQYFKTVELAARHFRDIHKYPGSLGFDVETGGFLALHKGHAPSALDFEVPVCLILKKLGFAVILEDEPPILGFVDATINGQKFEIKKISNAKNFKSAVTYQFRNAYKKSRRVLLHIDQIVNDQQLRGALSLAIMKHPVDLVWVVFRGKLYCYEKDAIQKGQVHFS